MSDKNIKAEAIRFKQNGREMFLTTLPAGILPFITETDVWDPNYIVADDMDPDELLGQGYQRAPTKAHYAKIARYLKNYPKAILPTSVLLNAREHLDFEPSAAGDTGILTIPNTQNGLYRVDGQHRIQGIFHALVDLGVEEIAKFPVPVTIMNGVDKLEEVQQFHTINTTQKRVRTDLADRLLRMIYLKDENVRDDLVSRGKSWKMRAVRVADMMNRNQEGPWYQRIRMPNAPRTPNAVATEASFTTSLRPVMNSDTLGDSADTTIAAVLANYWEAIKDLMPEAFESPADYVIQKTPGMYVMHMVAPLVLRECRDLHDLSQKGIAEILRNDEDHFVSEFWESGSDGAARYNSVGAFKLLSEDIKETLRPSLGKSGALAF